MLPQVSSYDISARPSAARDLTYLNMCDRTSTGFTVISLPTMEIPNITWLSSVRIFLLRLVPEAFMNVKRI